MTMTPFEQLWNQAEASHSNSPRFVAPILEELILKIKIYQASQHRQDLSLEELQSLRLHTMGEILFTLTKLSLADDINVYQALLLALQHHII
jgi:hypothetical protein